MKKTIAFVSALAIVFCCSFPVFATSGGVVDNFGSPYYFGDDHSVYVFLNLTACAPYRTPTGIQSYFNWNFDVLGQLIVFNDKDVDIQFTGSDTNHLRFIITTSSSAFVKNDGTTSEWRLADCTYIGGQLNVSAMFKNSLVQFETYTPVSDGSPSAITIPAHSNVTCYFKLTYATYDPVPSSGTSLFNPNFNSGSVSFLSAYSVSEYITGDFHQNYQSYIPDIYDNLVDLYVNNQAQLSVLQQILASYQSNVPGAQDVTDSAKSSSSTIDNQHQTESNFFSDSKSAIQDTGIQNFQFTPQELGGLNGLKDDFTAVWVSCGTLSRVWITSLTIGLALAIIRHRRMFQK